jgi:hypothetical protein
MERRCLILAWKYRSEMDQLKTTVRATKTVIETTAKAGMTVTTAMRKTDLKMCRCQPAKPHFVKNVNPGLELQKQRTVM